MYVYIYVYISFSLSLSIYIYIYIYIYNGDDNDTESFTLEAGDGPMLERLAPCSATLKYYINTINQVTEV